VGDATLFFLRQITHMAGRVMYEITPPDLTVVRQLDAVRVKVIGPPAIRLASLDVDQATCRLTLGVETP
jgi:hypothetical protein